MAVKDIRKSFDFYAKLGFSKKGGDIAQNWIVLKNGNAVIGLFQGMFEKNILTREADENGAGPASFTLEDPDGNAILFDQYR